MSIDWLMNDVRLIVWFLLPTCDLNFHSNHLKINWIFHTHTTYKIIMAINNEHIKSNQGHRIDMHKTTKLISNGKFEYQAKLTIFRMHRKYLLLCCSPSRCVCRSASLCIMLVLFSCANISCTFTWTMNCKSCNLLCVKIPENRDYNQMSRTAQLFCNKNFEYESTCRNLIRVKNALAAF